MELQEMAILAALAEEHEERRKVVDALTSKFVFGAAAGKNCVRMTALYITVAEALGIEAYGPGFQVGVRAVARVLGAVPVLDGNARIARNCARINATPAEREAETRAARPSTKRCRSKDTMAATWERRLAADPDLLPVARNGLPSIRGRGPRTTTALTWQLAGDHFRAAAQAVEDAAWPDAPFDEKERAIIERHARGDDRRTIAANLHVSSKTITPVLKRFRSYLQERARG